MGLHRGDAFDLGRNSASNGNSAFNQLGGVKEVARRRDGVRDPIVHIHEMALAIPIFQGLACASSRPTGDVGRRAAKHMGKSSDKTRDSAIENDLSH